MEKRIEVSISNQDYAAHEGDFIDPSDYPLSHAVKRALAVKGIQVEALRFGTLNVNTKDAQIGKLDKSFDNHDYSRLLNQFLKGIQFDEKRILTLFEKPQKFTYPTYTITTDDFSNFESSPPKEAIREESLVGKQTEKVEA